MKLLKHVWIITIIVCLLCASVAVLELVTSIVRGYGFLGTVFRMPEPYWEHTNDLEPVRKYCAKNSRYTYRDGAEVKKWPEPEEIANNVDTVRLSASQPYKQFDIWIFESLSCNARYLYTPLVINMHDPYLQDVNNLGPVVMCSMAKWEGPSGVYHPYQKYPSTVINYLGGEKWTCLTGDFIQAKSVLPPIPGALPLDVDDPGAYVISVRWYYPDEIKLALKAIYPNVEVPEDAIQGIKAKLYSSQQYK